MLLLQNVLNFSICHTNKNNQFDFVLLRLDTCKSVYEQAADFRSPILTGPSLSLAVTSMMLVAIPILLPRSTLYGSLMKKGVNWFRWMFIVTYEKVAADLWGVPLSFTATTACIKQYTCTHSKKILPITACIKQHTCTHSKKIFPTTACIKQYHVLIPRKYFLHFYTILWDLETLSRFLLRFSACNNFLSHIFIKITKIYFYDSIILVSWKWNVHKKKRFTIKIRFTVHLNMFKIKGYSFC